ncbi:hypothetical protein K458DRAFT_389884 [Lentithecium fluviatile CBS 122367]|uniref:Beta-lactamase-related domain-containing protein n=1 Tax=Lentithecium fluviatile CBS 122367 TaxID=1168545 RepID=A0A6G1IYD6_9PLEO|nr:hypothetical protein K458DRAFT_389884 [Lentithecium fluviatile CBS 122367]
MVVKSQDLWGNGVTQPPVGSLPSRLRVWTLRSSAKESFVNLGGPRLVAVLLGYFGKITLVDLLAHRTGYARLDTIWVGQCSEVLVSQAELIARVNALPRIRGSRSEWMYNNWMYALAGLVIVRTREEKSYLEFMKKRVLQEFGLNRSCIERNDVIDDNSQAYAASIAGTPMRGADPLTPRKHIHPKNDTAERYITRPSGAQLRHGLHATHALVRTEPPSRNQAVAETNPVPPFVVRFHFTPDLDAAVVVLGNTKALGDANELVMRLLIGQILNSAGRRPQYDYVGVYVGLGYTMKIALGAEGLVLHRGGRESQGALLQHYHYGTFSFATASYDDHMRLGLIDYDNWRLFLVEFERVIWVLLWGSSGLDADIEPVPLK